MKLNCKYIKYAIHKSSYTEKGIVGRVVKSLEAERRSTRVTSWERRVVAVTGDWLHISG